MADKTGIEWTGATWNPVVGCSLVSPGCTHCYAMDVAARLLDRPGSHYHGTTTRGANGAAAWTGRVAAAPDPIWSQPLRWTRPRLVFVDSMGDLFHEDVPDRWIDRAFAVMALARRHVFQVLTKRPERMRAYMDAGIVDGPRGLGARLCVAAWELLGHADPGPAPAWPLPNVWLGTSIEDRPRGRERAWHLAHVPAAVRFWSCEPLLADLGDLTALCLYDTAFDGGRPIDWVIAGGESGPRARPMHPDWVRSIRDQCAAAGVPFFFKQWGEWAPALQVAGSWINTSRQPRDPRQPPPHFRGRLESGGAALFNGRSFATRSFASDDELVVKLGKHRAGRALDGRIHDAMPVSDRLRGPAPAP